VAKADEFGAADGHFLDGAGAVERDLDRDGLIARFRRRALTANGEVHDEAESLGGAATFYLTDDDGEVVALDRGKSEQEKSHGFPRGEIGAQGLPLTGAGFPVVLVEVRSDPDVGASALVGDEKVDRLLQHRRDVGRGRSGGGRGQIAQGGGVSDPDRIEGGAVDENDLAARGGFFDQVGEPGEGGGAFRLAGFEILLLHAGGAVEEDEERVGLASGESGPASGEGAARGEDERGDGEDTHREDEDLPQAGEALRHFLRVEEEHHRRPPHGAVTMLIDQVNDDRQQRERQSDEEDGLQETHLAVRAVLGLRPMRKRARTWS